MKLVHERLHYGPGWALPHLYLFTGNPIVTREGKLVMGRGAAKEVRNSYSGVDYAFGQILTQKPDANLTWVSLRENQFLGWFRVKDHWQEPAKIELIQASAEELTKAALAKKTYHFHMNFPGIGSGKLEYKDVLPVLQTLPDNVYLYREAPQLEIADIPWPAYFRLIVAGSRSWTDVELMKKKLNEYYLANTTGKPALIIISGDAKGADQLGEYLATTYKHGLEIFPAEWEIYRKAAGYRRNEQMAHHANGAIIFWDGESPGSLHMANIAHKQGLPMWLVRADGTHTTTPPT